MCPNPFSVGEARCAGLGRLLTILGGAAKSVARILSSACSLPTPIGDDRLSIVDCQFLFVLVVVIFNTSGLHVVRLQRGFYGTPLTVRLLGRVDRSVGVGRWASDGNAYPKAKNRKDMPEIVEADLQNDKRGVSRTLSKEIGPRRPSCRLYKSFDLVGFQNHL